MADRGLDTLDQGHPVAYSNTAIPRVTWLTWF